jgi:hypothetical protein
VRCELRIIRGERDAPAVGAAVLARFDAEHNITIGEDYRDGVDWMEVSGMGEEQGITDRRQREPCQAEPHRGERRRNHMPASCQCGTAPSTMN